LEDFEDTATRAGGVVIEFVGEGWVTELEEAFFVCMVIGVVSEQFKEVP